MVGVAITLYAGLEHAFETDHLLAVSSLVTNRNSIKKASKDGVFWGVGHTFTIFVVGIIMIGFKVVIKEHIFSYLEGSVGLMLIILGVFRLIKLFKKNTHSHTHSDGVAYTHSHSGASFEHRHSGDSKGGHTAAFGVGLVHGLAGSGALVVLVIAQMKTVFEGLMYILIFGIGSIFGMFLASGLFSVPFAKNVLKSQRLQYVLIIISSLLCIIYGLKVVYENFMK